MEDGDLVARYRAGDVEALGELVERYRRPLFGYLVNLVGSTVEADEIFQETWLRVIRKIDEYRAGNFPGWLMRVARNIMIDRSRRKRPEVSLDREEGGRGLLHVIPGRGQTPSEDVADAELGQKIAEAVASLPEEQKEVFLLRTKSRLAFKDVATVQGISINTALARMQYALQKLRPLLRQEFDALPAQRTAGGGAG